MLCVDLRSVHKLIKNDKSTKNMCCFSKRLCGIQLSLDWRTKIEILMDLDIDWGTYKAWGYFIGIWVEKEGMISVIWLIRTSWDMFVTLTSSVQARTCCGYSPWLFKPQAGKTQWGHGYTERLTMGKREKLMAYHVK